jgi:hypothetical protein
MMSTRDCSPAAWDLSNWRNALPCDCTMADALIAATAHMISNTNFFISICLMIDIKKLSLQHFGAKINKKMKTFCPTPKKVIVL